MVWNWNVGTGLLLSANIDDIILPEEMFCIAGGSTEPSFRRAEELKAGSTADSIASRFQSTSRIDHIGEEAPHISSPCMCASTSRQRLRPGSKSSSCLPMSGR
jgi:hypothetical protein